MTDSRRAGTISYASRLWSMRFVTVTESSGSRLGLQAPQPSPHRIDRVTGPDHRVGPCRSGRRSLGVRISRCVVRSGHDREHHGARLQGLRRLAVGGRRVVRARQLDGELRGGGGRVDDDALDAIGEATGSADGSAGETA